MLKGPLYVDHITQCISIPNLNPEDSVNGGNLRSPLCFLPLKLLTVISVIQKSVHVYQAGHSQNQVVTIFPSEVVTFTCDFITSHNFRPLIISIFFHRFLIASFIFRIYPNVFCFFFGVCWGAAQSYFQCLFQKQMPRSELFAYVLSHRDAAHKPFI